MEAEILYIAGCPNHRAAVERLQAVLKEEGVRVEVIEVEVRDAAASSGLSFPGSPTIRINGQDIEPPVEAGGGAGLCCRTYMEGGVRQGAPPMDLLCAAVRRAKREQES